jgi:uncharacterized protein
LGLKQVILSNGVRIYPEDVNWMAQNDVRLMISLDGVGEGHDSVRPYRNGKGSFNKIIKTIDQILLPQGMVPMITVTLTQKNAFAAADAVRWALERNLQVSLNFYRQKPGGDIDMTAEEDVLIQGMLKIYDVYEEFLPRHPFLNGLLDRVQFGGHLHPCGAGLSYLVINHKGALSPCQMLLDRPTSRVLQDDLLSLIQQQDSLQNVAVDQKQTCNACIFRYQCAGGCPLETYRVNGRWDVPGPNCRIYKTLFPVVLRLEGLRLLKNYGYLH